MSSLLGGILIAFPTVFGILLAGAILYGFYENEKTKKTKKTKKIKKKKKKK